MVLSKRWGDLTCVIELEKRQSDMFPGLMRKFRAGWLGIREMWREEEEVGVWGAGAEINCLLKKHINLVSRYCILYFFISNLHICIHIVIA
jgi:hypothetical protein